MCSSTELFGSERREPSLDTVDPRRTPRCEVYVEPRTLRQPTSDRGRLVRRVVVHHEMGIEMLGHLLFDRLQELLELDRVDDIRQSLLRSRRRVQQIKTSFRGEQSRGFDVPDSPVAWAEAAEFDRALGSVISRLRREPGPSRADGDRGPQYRELSRRTEDLWKA